MASEFYYAQPGPITMIGLPDQRIGIWLSPTWRVYDIDKVEPICVSQAFTFDIVAISALGAIAAGATRNNVTLANLQLSDNPTEALQLRGFVLDDIMATIQMGAADTRFKTRSLVARIDRMTAQRDPCGHSTEFMVLGVNQPFVSVQNASNYAIAQARICFYGFRYILGKLEATYNTSKEAREVERMITLVPSGGF